jgi:hypothetical protein
MHPLSQTIRSLQHRLIWLRRAVAACWIVAVAIAAALVLGLIDYTLRYNDAGLRIMATTALCAAIVWAAYRWWYLPRQERLHSIAVARRVESHFPQLYDSLASAVEFLGQSEDDQTAGSAQLRRLVIADAQNKIEALPLNEIVNRRPLRTAAAVLAVVAAVALVCLAVNPSAVRTAFTRLIAPLGATEWPQQHRLVFRNTPEQLVAGQAFEAELVDEAGTLPDEVKIEFSIAHSGGRDATTELMKRRGDMMVARRENVRQSFAFRATGGDDNTMPWHWVEVKEGPKLDSLTMTVHPPAYTGLPPTKAEHHVEVLQGSGIEVAGAASEPICAARILPKNDEPIEATVSAYASGAESRAFRIGPEKWVASQSGDYRLELTNEAGLASVVGEWNLRVHPDSPPNVTWQKPAGDIFVLPHAVVPIDVVVKDDLAVQRVDLTYERNDRSESERAMRPKEAPIELYRGPAKPIVVGDETRGESRVIEYAWDLAPMQLPIGAVITAIAEAADYRPAVGRTIGPRRISIINTEELESRLAERQSQIVRQLERALTIERRTREDASRIAIQVRDATSLTSPDRTAIQTAEPNQIMVRRMLVDPAEGVMSLVEGVLNELTINRLANSETGKAMSRLADELKRLSAGPLSVAERELTSARKYSEALPASDKAANASISLDPQKAGEISRSLAAAITGQDDVVTTLERLINELSGNADVRRFARLIAELHEDQLVHERKTRVDIGTATLPLGINDLSRVQLANLNKAVAAESAIAERYLKIEQAMDRLAQKLVNEKDPTGGTLSDAVELARRLTIAAAMEQTSADLKENRVAQALARETTIADDLQQVLNLLRNEGERRPQQLVDKLKQAERRLAELRQQLAALRQQIAKAEQAPNRTTSQQLQRLNEQQQNTRSNIEQLARELERSQATEASKSTQNAAKQLSNNPANQKPLQANAQRPSPSNQVKKAEQNLEDAAKKLVERRQQAEDDLALEFVRRFQTDLDAMVKQQQQVLKKTTELDVATKPGATLSAEQLKSVANLAAQERELADRAKEHSEILAGLAAVRMSLEDAERRLTTAAQLLDKPQTGMPAQTAEQIALSRLEAMLQTFAQTAKEAAPNPNANNQQPPAANNNPPQDQPQRRPTFELLEVKMLRMLQADLNQRTRAHEQRAKAGNQDAAATAAILQEAAELAVEQGRLAELVQKMLSRDNEQQER